ncbi:cache domain-containing sensor histidine kinase [Paenibacillus shenyangensis]|uniref:cache domain-containing sensor histidine kinase n=1 Tax=Paenibacillus sp. A9 TaxID=1284352 RepID=UPI00036C5330|nr:sensor histidine kinase [Paenibacillus sp. A9]
MKRWRSILPTSLRGKLIVSAVCCLLLTIGAGTLLSSWMTKGMMKETVEQNAGDSLDAANLYLTDQINRLIYISNYLYLDNELNLSLKYQQSGFYVGQTRASDIMRKLDNLSYAGERVYISVWNGDGTMMYSNFQSDQYQVKGLDMSSLVHSEQFTPGGRLNFWLHPSYLQMTDQSKPAYMLSVARSLRLLSGQVYGYVVVSMDEQRLREVLNQYRSTIQMMVVGPDNKIISHPDETKIGQPFDKSSLADRDMLEVERNMSVSGWRLEGLVPYGVAAQKINRIYQVTSTVQMVVVLLFLLLLMLGIARMTKPIAKLARVVRKIDNNHLHIRSGIRGDDEAGLLGQSLDEMLDRVERMIVQVKQEQGERRRAELEMLQAQINPHFLFNILGAIRMDLLLQGSEEAARLLGSLSSLLRMTVNRGNEMITLREELETVQHYICLVDFQREVRVHLDLELEPAVMEKLLPRFIIQPLVENAYQHGLSKYGGILWIQGWIEQDCLWLSIRDSGEGMTMERLHQVRQQIIKLADEDNTDGNKSITYEEKPTGKEITQHMSAESTSASTGASASDTSSSLPGVSGIGLRNVIRRLYMIYGADVEVRIDSHPGEGTEIVLGLPLNTGNRRSGDVSMTNNVFE